MLYVFNYYDLTAAPCSADAFAMLAISTHLPGSFWHGRLASFLENEENEEEEEEEEEEEGCCMEGTDRSPPPHTHTFFCNGIEVSLITVHARLQMSLGSDRLESRPKIITCSGLVRDQSSMALRYLEGSVNKVLMQWMRRLWSALCCAQWPNRCYSMGLGCRSGMTRSETSV